MCEVANKSKLSSFTVINVLFLPVPEKVSMPPALLRSALFWLFIKIQLFIEYNLQLMYCQEVMTVSVLLFETTCLSNSCLCIFKPPYLAKSYLSSLVFNRTVLTFILSTVYSYNHLSACSSYLNCSSYSFFSTDILLNTVPITLGLTKLRVQIYHIRTSWNTWNTSVTLGLLLFPHVNGIMVHHDYVWTSLNCV